MGIVVIGDVLEAVGLFVRGQGRRRPAQRKGWRRRQCRRTCHETTPVQPDMFRGYIRPSELHRILL